VEVVSTRLATDWRLRWRHRAVTQRIVLRTAVGTPRNFPAMQKILQISQNPHISQGVPIR